MSIFSKNSKIIIVFCWFGLNLSACNHDEGGQTENGSLRISPETSSANIPAWWPEFATWVDSPADQELADRLRQRLRDERHKSGPGALDAVYALAIVERDSGGKLQAAGLFREVLEKRSGRAAGAAWNLGRLALLDADDPAEAGSYFEQACALDADAWQPIYALSQLRRRQGRHDEANQLWEKARTRGAGRMDARGGMGAMKMQLTLDDLEWL